MPASLFKNLMIVYKPVLFWNILINLLIGLFFVIDGYEQPGGYAMIVFMKPAGWAFSMVIEQFFLQKHRYFYKNMGLGFRRILINIMLYDIGILLLIIITCLLCRNFLLTVLPGNLIRGQY